MIEPIDEKESSNGINEPRDSRCKKDSDCPIGETCSIVRVLASMPPQPVYDCVKPNANPKSPKQGIFIEILIKLIFNLVSWVDIFKLY